MPSVQYMNQSAPFWDFISSLEQQGQNHPFFAQFTQNNGNAERNGHPGGPPFAPWGWGGWGAAFPHRGPPPPNEEPAGEKDVDMDDEKAAEGKDTEKENDNGEGPSGAEHEGRSGHRRRGGRHCNHGDKGEGSGSDTEGWAGHRRCGGGRRGRHHGPPGYGPHGAWGHHGHHGHHGRGGFGPRGRGWGGPWAWGRGGPPQSFNPIEFAANLFNPEQNQTDKTEDFTPDADIFDTPSAYVIHVSLPGAKKEDVGVNWDAEKSELSIAGVIYRPGDEEFLKTLAVDERAVGPFERKVRLGTRASPANVDAEGINAKLEDGVLRVEVPKLEKEGFVEVRKVDIE